MWIDDGFAANGARGYADTRARKDREHDLVTALRREEPDAAERLLHTYGARAFRLAVRITRARPDAEEVVQDALLTVVRKIASFRGDAAFGSWVYRIVANSAYQKIRARRRRQDEVSADAVPGLMLEGGRLAADDPARQTEVRTALTEAIDELPQHYRTVFVLRDLQGLSTVEIGRALRLSASNVKTRVHRARALLRERLDGGEATPPYPVAV
jgi:RNA polymerase sigma-70 factor (ECF subfamily)